MIQAADIEIVTGPQDLQRFGKSLIVQPTCETHRAGRFPTQAVVVTSAARRIIELSKAGEKLKSIVVSGEVPPTQHPEFLAISQNLRELCNKWFPKAKLVVISDSHTLESAEVRRALAYYDQPIVRHASGTQKTFAALTGAKPQELKVAVDNLARLDVERWVLETCFVRGEVDNSTESEVRLWVNQIAQSRPAAVQIYTLPRPKGRNRRPVPKTRMEEIAAKVTDKTGIPVEICG